VIPQPDHPDVPGIERWYGDGAARVCRHSARPGGSMTKLPRITGQKMVVALRKVGFEVIRTRGSHFFLRHRNLRGRLLMKKPQ
jgi:predicted RNA binding protein YcfA (HicA-like mRNA interferase family)